MPAMIRPRRSKPIHGSTQRKSPTASIRSWELISRRRAPLGSTNWTRSKPSLAVPGCDIQNSMSFATDCSKSVRRLTIPGPGLQPRLKADKAQVNLLGPAPAAGQPPEPEQAALARAESNYHLSLLSGGKAAVDSTNLRIENLLNAIQDIRRKNFTSILFQPIPGVYAYETWAKLPNYVPSA